MLDGISSMDIYNIEIAKLYDRMWEDALAHFAKGRVETDDYLAKRQSDRRLGITVMARPSEKVVEQFTALNHRLAQVEPDQYYYQPAQFHITVLSLFTATEHCAPYFARLADFLAASGVVLASAPGFAAAFHGVTATPNGILAQGFPQDGHLEALREKLRKALREQDLGQGLDTRYRLKTAHATLMRFQRPAQALLRLVELLKEYRDFHFGDCRFQTLQVVKNDWYMSTDRVEVLAEYRLS
jgi:2'-5' RNA ligase